MTFGNDTMTIRCTFVVDSVKKNGWAKMRMCAIDQIGNKPSFEEYDPEKHKENHYMGISWMARTSYLDCQYHFVCGKNCKKREKTYIIIMSEGIIFHKKNLIPSEIIKRLE